MGFEQVLGGMWGAVAVGRTQQRHPALAEVDVELAGHVALVGDDREPGSVGGQRRVVVECGDQDLAFIDLRVGQRPGDREPGRGRDQVQAQPPEEAGVTGAVAVAGPPGKVGTLHGRSGTCALDRGGIHHPYRVRPQVGVEGQNPDQLLDQR